MKEENKLFQELYLLVFSLNQPATLQEIFDKSLTGIMEVLEVDRASLLTFDDQDIMRFRAWLNLSPRYRRAVDGHSPWSPDEKDPTPLLIPDVRQDPELTELLPIFEHEGIRALGFIPLLNEDRLIGKFMLYYDIPHTFTEEEIQLAEIVAHHVVNAIDRSQTQQALLQQAQQQRLLAELGQHALSSYFRLSELMTLIVEQTAEILNVDLCELLALEPDRKTLRLVAGVGWQEGLVGEATIEAGPNSHAGYTMEQHHPVIVTDLRCETRFKTPELLQDHNAVSGMTVIIQGGNRPYGVLGVHTTSPRRFTRDEVNFLHVLANIIAAAVQQKQALAALQTANNFLEERVAKRTTLLNQEIAQRESAEKALRRESAYIQLLYEINEIANEPHSLEQSFRLIIDKICQFTAWPLGHVYIQASDVLEDGRPDEMVSSNVWYCKDTEQFTLFRDITAAQAVKRGVGWVGKVFHTGKPTWIKSPSEDQLNGRIEQLTAAGLKAGLAFPVMVGDQVAAVMEFFTFDFEQPNEELIGIMSQIGTQMGRVVERERARKEVEQSERNLRALADRLIRSQEEERSRISHELHDEIGQALSALKLELDMLSFDDNIGPDLQELLNRSRRVAKITLERLQLLSYDLRPPELDTIGLEAALHDLCQDFVNRGKFEVEYRGAGYIPANISDAVNLSLYRALQEGLNNAARYSDATHVIVDLSYDDGDVSLLVTYNNSDQNQLSGAGLSEQGLGLLGLSERFARLGGSVTINSNPETGATLQVVVPWKE